MEMIHILDMMRNSLPSRSYRIDKLKEMWNNEQYNETASEAVEIIKNEIEECQKYGITSRTVSAIAMLDSLEWSIRTKAFTTAGSKVLEDWYKNKAKASNIVFALKSVTWLLEKTGTTCPGMSYIVEKASTQVVAASLTLIDIIRNKNDVRKHLYEAAKASYQEAKTVCEHVAKKVRKIVNKTKEVGKKALEGGKVVVSMTGQIISTTVQTAHEIYGDIKEKISVLKEKTKKTVKNAWEKIKSLW